MPPTHVKHSRHGRALSWMRNLLDDDWTDHLSERETRAENDARDDEEWILQGVQAKQRAALRT